MMAQTDLFGFVDDALLPDELIAAPPPSPAALAVPCGFLNRSNQPCLRLAHRPVMIDGVQLVCREHVMLHCEPGCYGSVKRRDEEGDDRLP